MCSRDQHAERQWYKGKKVDYEERERDMELMRRKLKGLYVGKLKWLVGICKFNHGYYWIAKK